MNILERSKLKDKVVIVTGAGSGIGRAVSHLLLNEGASMAIVDFNQRSIQDTIELLNKTNTNKTAKIIGIVADARKEKDTTEMAKEMLDNFGRIDILVHCAGILRGKGGTPKILAQISTEEMNNVIDTNLKGTFLSNRAVLPTMIKQRSGQIINISSTSGLKGQAFDSVYCASKFGVIGLSESLAEEVRQYGIRVQVVIPGAVDTPLWDQNGPIRAPEHSLSAERVAELIIHMLTLPKEIILENAVIAPFVSRKRKTRSS